VRRIGGKTSSKHSSAPLTVFISQRNFGLASGKKTDGAYQRVWFQQIIAPDEGGLRG
jgi:hypothetical protein